MTALALRVYLLVASVVGVAMGPIVFLAMMDRTLVAAHASQSMTVLIAAPGLVLAAAVCWVVVFVRATRFHWFRLRRWRRLRQRASTQ